MYLICSDSNYSCMNTINDNYVIIVCGSNVMQILAEMI